MANTSYATITELKTRVSAEGTSTSDNWLQQLLNAAAVLVDRNTRGYKPGYEAFVATAADETRLFDDDTTRGWVDIDDAVSVTSVSRGGVLADPTAWMKAPYNVGQGPYTQIIWAKWMVAPTANLFYSAQYPNVGAAQVSVVGKFGYCTSANIPACVKEATLRIAEGWYEASQISPGELGLMLINPQQMVRADVLITLLPVRREMRLG